jgi:hypothetical protein
MLAGCSKEAEHGQLLNSDANGFICRQCKAKFFTARSVFADKCPSCQSPDVAEVVGFFCAKDQHLTLAPKAKFANCEKCGEATGLIRLPTSADLLAWGATKKREADVK